MASHMFLFSIDKSVNDNFTAWLNNLESIQADIFSFDNPDENGLFFHTITHRSKNAVTVVKEFHILIQEIWSEEIHTGLIQYRESPGARTSIQNALILQH